VLRRLEASPLPVVAACQGLCLAGGLELMLACDVIFAARDAASATSTRSSAWCPAGAAASACRA
jgi:enoyl-CoA hydratase/carnithine racemase